MSGCPHPRWRPWAKVRPYAFRPFSVSLVGARRDRPRPRSGHRIACTSGALFSVGGYNPERRPGAFVTDPPDADDSTWSPARPIFRELWKYNLARRRWRRLPGDDSLPEHLASSAVCLVGETLMMFGGTGAPFGHRCSNSLYTYDTTSDRGRFDLAEATGAPPPPQYGQAILFKGGHLYAIGGTDGQLYTIDVHRLNMRTLVWENVFTCKGNRNEPEARYRHELAVHGDDLYVLAGGTAEFAYDFIDIPVFDLRTFSWSFRRSIPEPGRGYPAARKCHSAVQLADGDRIDAFIMGGFDNENIFSDIWRLEIPSLRWTLMRKSLFPLPLYFHSSAITPEGCMYTFGGIQASGATARSNKMYKVWLCIPKLSEICWESLLHYFPHIINTDRSKLLKEGIPNHFVKRLDM